MAVINTEAQYNALVRKLKAGDYRDRPEMEKELIDAAKYYSQRPIINRVQKVTREEGQSYWDKPKLSWDITRGQHPSEDTDAQRAVAAGIGGFVEGVADIADVPAMLATAPLYGAHKLAASQGLAEDPGAYFGDEGYLDLSGAVTKAVDENLGDDVRPGQESVRGFGRVAGQTVGTLGVGSALNAGRLKTLLTEQPVLQMTGALTGEGARQWAEGQGAGTGGQFLANIAGSMAPAVAAASLKSAILGLGTTKNAAQRQALRKGLTDVATVNDVSRKILKKMETDADYAEAMEAEGFLVSDFTLSGEDGPARIAATVPGGLWEGVMRRLPGSAGRIAKVADGVERRVQKILEVERKGLGPIISKRRPADPYKFNETSWVADRVQGRVGAGEAVEQSLHDVRRQVKEQGADSYRRLNEEIDATLWELPPEAELMEAPRVQSLINSFREGGEFSDILSSPTMLRLLKRFNKAEGNLTYEDMRAMRTAVGRKLGNPTFLDDIPRGELKRLYGAITQDIDNYLTRIDDTGYLSARARSVDADYRRNMEVLDTRLQKFVQKIDSKAANTDDLAETLWQQANNERGTQRLETLFEYAFDGDHLGDWREVQSFVLDRMMRPPRSSNKSFDLIEFAKKWDDMPAKNKDIIFGGMNTERRKALENIVGVAKRARTSAAAQPGATVLGTGAIANLAGIGGVGAGIYYQNMMWPLIGLGAAVAGANGMARGLTNPKFANWLLKASRKENLSNNLTALLPGLVTLVKEDPTLDSVVRPMLSSIGLMAGVEQENEEVQQTLNKYLGAE